MNLSAPKKLTFLIALIIVLVGVLFAVLPALASLAVYAVPVLMLGFVVLALGNILKGW